MTAEAGWDPDYYCLLDAPEGVHRYPSGSGADEPILIINADGEAVELPSLAPLIVSLGDERRPALNLYLPGPVRDALRAEIAT